MTSETELWVSLCVMNLCFIIYCYRFWDFQNQDCCCSILHLLPSLTRLLSKQHICNHLWIIYYCAACSKYWVHFSQELLNSFIQTVQSCSFCMCKLQPLSHTKCSSGWPRQGKGGINILLQYKRHCASRTVIIVRSGISCGTCLCL